MNFIMILALYKIYIIIIIITIIIINSLITFID